jgi:hypothetical protein
MRSRAMHLLAGISSRFLRRLRQIKPSPAHNNGNARFSRKKESEDFFL